MDIVDGDTILMADGTRVRLAIVDTPELGDGARGCGRAAAAFVGSFLAGETVAVYRPTTGPDHDSFGRRLGEVARVVDGASLNVGLVQAGLGVIDQRFTAEDPDLAQRLRAAAAVADDPDCETVDAERDATQPQPSDNGAADSSDSDGGTGEPSGDDGGVVIATVRYDGPGNDVEVYNDSEYVELRNDSAADIDISGWSIIDEADNSVRITSGFTIPAGSSFRVYSGQGDDDPRARYYAGRGQAYLNNSGGDTLRLFDATGAQVDTHAYSS